MSRIKNFMMDQEDQFYCAATDAKFECKDVNQFVELMSKPEMMKLVSHLEVSEVTDTLKEMWYE